MVTKTKARIVSSSPLLFNGKLYIGDFAGYFYAISSDNGKVVWKKQLKGKIVSSAVAYKNMLIIGSTKGIVYAMNLKNGSLFWKKDVNARIEVSPIVWKGKLFLPADNFLFVISIRTGDIFWKHNLGNKITSSPNIIKVSDNELILIGDVEGNFYALNSKLKVKRIDTF